VFLGEDIKIEEEEESMAQEPALDIKPEIKPTTKCKWKFNPANKP
jgi:hypothetical protein